VPYGVLRPAQRGPGLQRELGEGVTLDALNICGSAGIPQSPRSGRPGPLAGHLSWPVHRLAA